jgi:hypothetical protein
VDSSNATGDTEVAGTAPVGPNFGGANNGPGDTGRTDRTPTGNGPTEIRDWSAHPGVRSGDRLTVGERAADKMRNGMGSWPFVFSFLVVMGMWALVNTGVLGKSAWDPYPYILLNLFLSMLAGLQGAVLLIAAKRADQISAETALHTLTNTELLKTLIEQNTDLTRQIHQLTTAMNEHLAAS